MKLTTTPFQSAPAPQPTLVLTGQREKMLLLLLIVFRFEKPVFFLKNKKIKEKNQV